MDLESKLNLVPKLPGIYFFKNKRNEIIYIGKAKVLRNRVKSYFLKNIKGSKTQIMVNNITDLEWLVVGSEVEALLTEANFIKEHKPRYNIFLKDDKTFPYIRITNEPYPRVEIVRQKNLTKDVMKVFDLKNSINSKSSYGGTSLENIKKMIISYKKNRK